MSVRLCGSIFFFLLFFAAGYQSFSQEGQAKKLLEEAKTYMAKGDYLSADQKFRQILSLTEVIPTDALYFFAYTLDKNHQLQSSKNFLNKYFELTGKSGDYFNEAKILQSKLEKKSAEIDACGFCDGDGFRLVSCPVCEGVGKLDGPCTLCHGFGTLTCHKCLGEGVLISQSEAFGDNLYKTCEVCNGSGKETCSNCHGAKHLIQECDRCLGTGHIGSAIVCNHQKETFPSLIKPSGNK